MKTNRVNTIIGMSVFYLVTLSVFPLISEKFYSLTVNSICFWGVALIVELLYLKCSLTDPGFLSLNKPTRHMPLQRKDNGNSGKRVIRRATQYKVLSEDISVEEGGDVRKSESFQQDANVDDDFFTADERFYTVFSEGNDDSGIFGTPPGQGEPWSRFCTVCQIPQPLRVKHCKCCERCVALHDHHCPWLAVCVGEKNRRWFYFYILFQCILLWAGDLSLILSLEPFENDLEVIIVLSVKVLLLIVLGFFTLMVTCLLLFHSYLACKNLTTWELVSWQKISYLKEYDKADGSPFSSGAMKNLYMYCCEGTKGDYKEWELTEHHN